MDKQEKDISERQSILIDEFICRLCSTYRIIDRKFSKKKWSRERIANEIGAWIAEIADKNGPGFLESVYRGYFSHIKIKNNDNAF